MTLDLGLYACPACKHEDMTIGADGKKVVCSGCLMEYPVKPDYPDFRYMEANYRSGEINIDDEHEHPEGLRASEIRKFGSTYIMTRKLKNRISHLRKTRGKLRVLDIGMFFYGEGAYKPFIRGIEEHIELYVGIDASEYELGRPANGNENEHAIRAYGEYLPLRADQFDLVISVATFDHMFAPDLCLNEIKRVMAPEGSLFITLSNKGAWFKQMLSSYAAKRQEAARQHHNFFWTSSEFRQLLNDQGFQVSEYTGHRFFPVFDNMRPPHLIPNFIQVPVCGMIDLLGNSMFPDLGGTFAVLCRSSN